MQLPVKPQVAHCANDYTNCSELSLRMMQPNEIHPGKAPFRIHFIPEWAEKRSLKQVDIVRELGADKGTVSRWFDGQLPNKDHLPRIAALFQIEVPALFRDPEEDWLWRFFRDKSEEQRTAAVRALRGMLDFIDKTGTND